MSGVRRQSYRVGRGLGTIEAAAKGPGPLAKRMVRRAVYKRGNGMIRSLLRGFGL